MRLPAATERRIKDGGTEAQMFRSRAVQGFAFVVLCLLALAGRYAWLQLVQYEEYATRSESNRVRLQPVAPARGLIHDRNGVLLAENRPAFRLELVPERVDDLEQVLAALAQRVQLDEMDLEKFHQAWAGARRYQPVPLKFRLSELEIARLAIDQHRFPAVQVTPYQSRHYVYGPMYAHLVGYVGRIDEADQARLDRARYAGTTHVGKTGLERYYEDFLHGAAGLERVETHANGRPLRVLSSTPPQPGQHLYLTVDHRLQEAAIRAFEGQNGAAIAVDPRNGEVLAMVSLPAFDANLFVSGISRANYAALLESPDRPLFNRAVQGGYEPGSTLKPLMVLMGLELGLRRPGDTVLSTGQFRLPGHEQVYRDWRRGGHGRVDARRAIAESVNTYFYQLAVDAGIDQISRYMAGFGFGRPAGLDLLGEGEGVLPSREWKRAQLNQPWYLGETVIAGIGQGYWVTTMPQLARATAILASAGRDPRLHLLRATADGVDAPLHSHDPGPAGQVPVIDPGHWQLVIEGMTDVVHGQTGTARAVGADSPYLIAGKTGTAQRVSRREGRDPADLASHLRHQALFVGFAPADEPRIAIAVVVEGGGSGSRTAAPLARKILDGWWRIQESLP